VPEGAALITKLIERAGKRIEILPGGGIRPYNLNDIVRRTRTRQIHMTAWSNVQDRSDLNPFFGTKLSMISAKERGSGNVEEQAHGGADDRGAEATGSGT
jgi:copper homeostasis protein CutC